MRGAGYFSFSARGPRIVVVAGVVSAGLALLAASALATRNVNFVGTWKPNSGAGWTITKENRKTGACTGKTALASQGYGFVACRVTGNKYTFTITYGQGYRSRNTGTIKGNTLKGSFKDTNGTRASYTAKRVK